MPDPIAERHRERAKLIAAARVYIDRLSARLDVEAAAVAGSVARGAFNLWSDVDVVVVAEGLPERALDRIGLLIADAPPRIQPVGFTPEELARALRRRNPLVVEALEYGVVLVGEEELAELVAQ